MADSTLNRFLARGSNAARVAFTPSPPTPASGPSPTYLWHETDTGDTYAYNGTAWDKVNSGLSAIADGDLLANISGGSAAPVANTLSGILDHVLGGTQGDVLYRGASSWAVLAPGTSGQVLTSGGAAANPSWAAASGGVSLIRPGGRLTLVSATPILNSDQTAKGTVYYTPYQTDLIPIYDGAAWAGKTFAELTLTLDATNHVSGSLYDVFVWNNSGTISVGTGPAWTSTTARGVGAGTTELQMLNGIWTNKNSITLKNGAGAGTAGIAANTATYVGTFYATANGQTGMAFKPTAAAGGTNNFLGLYNAYNRVAVGSVSRDSTVSWTYATATWRASNGSNSNRISFVDGLQTSTIDATNVFESNGSGVVPVGGANLDSTTAAPNVAAQLNVPTTSTLLPGVTRELFAPQLGLHYIQSMERSNSGTCTFYGAQPSGQVNNLAVKIEM